MAPRIFIADDHEIMLRWLWRELERDSSLEVCGSAQDGREAVAKALQLHPDIIVLDLAMPVMNGLDAARAIKQRRADVPILLFTLSDLAEVRAEAAAAGVCHVISKIKGFATLRLAIEETLKESAARLAGNPQEPAEAAATDGTATPQRASSAARAGSNGGSSKAS